MSGETMPRVSLDDLWYDASSGMYTHNGVPFTGIAFSVGRSGALESETEYHGGFRFGLLRGWHPDGSLAVEGMFRDDGLHGTYREWHKNGRLAIEQVGEYGMLLSEKTWDEQGRLVKEYTIEEGGGDWRSLQLRRKLFGSH